MRVTNAHIRASLLRRVNSASSRLLQLEEQAASGRRVSTADDDPVSSAIVRRIDSALADLESYEAPARQATARLETADGVLGSVFDQLVRIQELTLSMSNGAMSDEQRVMAGVEAEEIRIAVVGLGNTKLEEKYIFGGLDTDSAPFLPDGTFVGHDEVAEVEISPGVRVQAGPDGEEIFTDVGGIDINQVITDVRDALRAGDEVELRRLLSDVERAQTQIRVSRARLGPTINRIGSAEDIRENLRLELIEKRSDEIDADLPETLSMMTLTTQSLEAALTVTARALDHTLLNKLR